MSQRRARHSRDPFLTFSHRLTQIKIAIFEIVIFLLALFSLYKFVMFEIRHESRTCQGRTKGESATLVLVMGVRTCQVTVKDFDDIEHTVEVTAATLYEAVALGLKAIRKSDWSAEIAQGLNTVRVKTVDVPVEHSVKLDTFNKWLDRVGGNPKDQDTRTRIREILGKRT